MTDNGRPWVHEMVLIHRVFRREFKLAPDLVRAVRAEDRRGVARVARHLQFVLHGLHVHHSGEDELLWPLLAGRAELDASLLARMQTQHDTLALTTAEMSDALSRWRLSVGSETVAALIAAAERVHGLLVTHLDEEEQRVLPLVTTWITPAEWGRLAQHGFTRMPKSALFRQLGAILEDADSVERRNFLATLPPPVRLLWAALGRRRYDRYTVQLRGHVEPNTRPRAPGSGTDVSEEQADELS